MTVQWLQPLAWWGIGLLVLPIVIHLLARHRSRRVPFPSLKFLPVAQMAALRRRVVTDWPLLAVRLLILAVAVAAFASPVFVTEARRRSWDQRVARAIVVASPETDEIATIVAEEARSSVASAVFSAATVPDALHEAQRWLGIQPPAAREIVVVGDLRSGALSDHDLAFIPPYVGLRFLPVVAQEGREPVEWRAVAERVDGSPGVHHIRVTAEASSRTVAEYGDGPEGLPPAITIVASAEDQPFADALLRAVLREGLVLGSHRGRAVTVAFEGAALPGVQPLAPPSHAWMRKALERIPNARGGELDGVLVVRPSIPVRDARAPRIVAEVLHAAFAESHLSLEPRRVAADALAAWSRPAGASPASARPADEGDRRWLWGGVLVLLALEHALRRRPHAA